MQPKIFVHALPGLVEPEELTVGTVVVIDVLRATTSIVHAFAAGTKAVYPCAEVAEAERIAEELRKSRPGEPVLLAGERNCLAIDGFDLGNSPAEFSDAQVADAWIIFTTTNGTLAFKRCREAERVLVGAFVNASAVFRALAEEIAIVHLLCAGTDGEYGRDDTLLAGYFVDRLERAGGLRYELNAQALTARENWRAAFAEPYALGAEPIPQALLAEELGKSTAARKLVAARLEKDILDAAAFDRFDCVPRYRRETGWITRT
ncbi:MAG: 2-phosphosulfolactate phosphatase [Thermogutta sp.]